MYGYTGRLLRINLTKRSYRVEETPKDYLRRFLGGRGLAARLYYDEVGSGVGPLSPENKLIFFTGPLTGTPVFGSSKLSLATKSPETGIYLCTNLGGYIGWKLKAAGYDGLVIEGRADELLYLKIVEGEIEFVKAADLSQRGIYETQAMIKNREGLRTASVIAIGPAGENLAPIACIGGDRRYMGRGGAGAVMGSKNLKAILIDGERKILVRKLDELRDYLKSHVKELRETTGMHTKLGTLQYTDVMYELGAYPLFNFQRTTHEEMKEFRCENLLSRYKIGNDRCFSCPVGCAQICRFNDLTVKPEYETLWALGPQCGIFEFKPILEAIRLCNDYGLDGISAGVIIGFSMEAYERGIISRQELGVEARFGSPDAVFKLLEDMCFDKGLGHVLRMGVRMASEIFGKGSTFFAMHVKGMELSAYEPRSFHGIGLSFATSSRGACHNVGGWTIRDELLKKTIDRFAVEGKGLLVKSIQDVRAYIDSIGICTIPRRSLGLTDKPHEEILDMATSIKYDGTLIDIGERIYCLERAILNREGVNRAMDDLPPRIKEEPLPDGIAEGKVLTDSMLQKMLDEYYSARGWDSMGVVKNPSKYL